MTPIQENWERYKREVFYKNIAALLGIVAIVAIAVVLTITTAKCIANLAAHNVEYNAGLR